MIGPLATFVFFVIGAVSASDAADPFAPPPFDVAFFAPESLDEVDAVFGALARPIPDIWMAHLGASWPDMEIVGVQEVALRLVALENDFANASGVGVIFSNGHETKVAALVSGLIPWKDRRSGDSLLAQLGDGHDRWRVKVKPGPVPTVMLRADW